MGDSTTTGTGWLDLLRGGRAPLIAALTLGIWLHAADSLLIVTTLPSAVSEIGGAAYVSWAYTIYMLASILIGASTGLLTLTIGLRNAFLSAGALFAVGCVISALAPDMSVMLLGRFVQGMGGGGQVALVFVALDRLFPKPMLPKLVALTSAVWSMSAFCGPMVGGLFANMGMWRGAFWAFALQAVLFVILVLVAVPKDKKREAADGPRAPALPASLCPGRCPAPGLSGRRRSRPRHCPGHDRFCRPVACPLPVARQRQARQCDAAAPAVPPPTRPMALVCCWPSHWPSQHRLSLPMGRFSWSACTVFRLSNRATSSLQNLSHGALLPYPSPMPGLLWNVG